MIVSSMLSKWLARKGGHTFPLVVPIVPVVSSTGSFEREERGFSSEVGCTGRGLSLGGLGDHGDRSGEVLSGLRCNVAERSFPWKVNSWSRRAFGTAWPQKDRDKKEGQQFEVDWQVMSTAGLGDMFRELLADFLGAPKKEDRKRRFWWNQSDVSVDAAYKKVLTGKRGEFLIRGVIFEMSSLMEDTKWPSSREPNATRRQSGTPEVSSASAADDAGRSEPGVTRPVVEASEVIQNLGLGGIIPGLENKLATPSNQGKKKPQAKPSSTQEADSGPASDVRAKYADKIHQRKMFAAARRAAFGEQDVLASFRGGGFASRFGKVGPGGRGAEPQPWITRPGAPGLLRHLKERGLAQALLMVGGTSQDLPLLLDQLGNFPFRPQATGAPPADLPSDSYIREELERVWRAWGLLPKQVLLVAGSSRQGEAVLRVAAATGCYMCWMDGAYDNQTSLKAEDSPKGQELEKLGQTQALHSPTPLSSTSSTSITSETTDQSVENKNDETTNSISSEASRSLRSHSWNVPRRNGEQASGIRESRDDPSKVDGSSLLGRLREGFALVKDAISIEDGGRKDIRRRQGLADPHFRIAGMLELKKIIEDMNGVSYRGSTFIRDLKDQWNSSAPR